MGRGTGHRIGGTRAPACERSARTAWATLGRGIPAGEKETRTVGPLEGRRGRDHRKRAAGRLTARCETGPLVTGPLLGWWNVSMGNLGFAALGPQGVGRHIEHDGLLAN